MANIFVSYSQTDRKRVLPVVEALRAQGWSVWWDKEGAGGAILEEMVDREMKAAKCVVVLWSESSIKSDWVLGEADEARERRILVPAILDDTNGPRRFRQFNTVNLRSWDGNAESDEFRKLIAGVRTHIPTSDHTKTAADKRDDLPTDKPREKSRSWIRAGVLAVAMVAVGVVSWQFINPGQNSVRKPPRTAPTAETDNAAQAGATIKGRILFEGEPISTYSNAPAEITLLDSENRNRIPISLNYDANTATYELNGVPSGKYNAFVRIESGHPYDQESGGDYYGRLSGYNDPIEVPPNSTAITRDLKVLAVIHLLNPEDNQNRTRSTSDKPETFHIPGLRVRFRWEAVPKASRYELRFITEDANGDRVNYESKSVTDTTYTHRVPNNSDYKHMFSITAYATSGNIVGNYQYYYTNGSGGWFEYHVRSQ